MITEGSWRTFIWTIISQFSVIKDLFVLFRNKLQMTQIGGKRCHITNGNSIITSSGVFAFHPIYDPMYWTTTCQVLFKVRDSQCVDNWIEQRVKIIKNDCDIIYLKVPRFHVSPSNTLRQLETGAKKALPRQKQAIGFLLGVGFGQLCFAAEEMFLIWYFLQMQMLQPHKMNINIKK